MIVYIWFSYAYQGADPGFSERGLNVEVISEAGPPRATVYFINVTPKSCPSARFRAYLSKHKEL